MVVIVGRCALIALYVDKCVLYGCIMTVCVVCCFWFAFTVVVVTAIVVHRALLVLVVVCVGVAVCGARFACATRCCVLYVCVSGARVVGCVFVTVVVCWCV